MGPIQISTGVKRGFLLLTGNLVFIIENKPRFVSAPALDWIRATPRDLNESDPSWYGYFIRSRRL